MFLTIGFIVGFIAGWWVNEKVENLGEKINPLKLRDTEKWQFSDNYLINRKKKLPFVTGKIAISKNAIIYSKTQKNNYKYLF